MNNQLKTSEFPFLKQDEIQLEILTAKYPWCSVARLSLLHTYKKNKSPQFEEQARKTALFFNNTNWLNWQLRNLSKDENDIPVQIAPLQDESIPVTQIPLTGITSPSKEIVEEEIADIPDSIQTVQDESTIEILTPSTDKQPPGNIVDEENAEVIDSIPFEEEQTVEIEALAADNLSSSENIVEEEEEEKEVAVIPDPIPLVHDESTPGTQPTSQNIVEEVEVFEPLHTTDYFAALGIRLTDEPVSHDKLGTQLKSFTEWLKSMKKIHVEKLPPGDEQTDKNIQQIAEHSNTDAEIVTEAMAEVLEMQGKPGKAIEVYRKLSLIYPSKSAYFAGKIEGLSGDIDLKTP